MLSAPVPEVRNLQFATDENVPRYWHGGRKSVTIFLNNLSVFFPAGERFFIASVKAHRDFLKDKPQLAGEARAFYAQEGIHSREHVRYNAMLREQGYPVAEMEARVESLLELVKKLPDITQLGVTCSLEHFTALLADFLLGDPRLLDGADPVMARLWRWHAAEENEHKAVAFDVFKAAGGSYLERAGTMLGATVIFWAKVLEHQVRMMHHDKILFSGEEWRALGRFFFVEPGGIQKLLPKYLSYFRPSFHPWDHDNRALLEAWKLEIQNAPEYGRVA